MLAAKRQPKAKAKAAEYGTFAKKQTPKEADKRLQKKLADSARDERLRKKLASRVDVYDRSASRSRGVSVDPYMASRSKSRGRSTSISSLAPTEYQLSLIHI